MLTSLVSQKQGNVKKSEKSIKIINLEIFTSPEQLEEFRLNFWERSEKKSQKINASAPSIQNTFLKKPQGQSDHPPAFFGLSQISVV